MAKRFKRIIFFCGLLVVINVGVKQWKPVFLIILPWNKNLFWGISVSSGIANSTAVFLTTFLLKNCENENCKSS